MLPSADNPQHRCPKCGGPLDPTLPGGGCGACLLGSLVMEEAAAQAALGGLPEIVGYELREVIGRGGMGVVYRARQESSGREVALKMVAPDTLRGLEARQRFLMEVEAMAAVEHPALIPLYDAGEDSHGRPWLAMLYASGGTLSERLSTYARQWRRCAELLVTLARAVAYAHERGILHRDLKPANVLFDAAGHPYVADFGLAKWADEDGDLTRTASVLGSPAYLAPEVAAAGAHAATTAHDVYGLGAILYELLTGAHPYDGPSAMQVITKIIAGPPPPPRQMMPGIPRDLATITEKAMARDPARRYTSAAALADDLVLWLAGRPILARPVSAAERVLIWARRKPALAALVAVSVAGAVAFTILTQSANRRLAQESEVSRTHARLAREAEARALENGRTARRAAYISDMYAAAQSRLSGNYAAARRLLAAHVPAAGMEDLRGIEWHILMEQSEPDVPAYSFQMDRPVLALTAPETPSHFWATDEDKVRAWNVGARKEGPEWVPQTHVAGLPIAALRAGPSMQSWDAAAKLAKPEAYEYHSREDFQTTAALEGELLDKPSDVQCAADGKWLAIATMRRGVSLWDNKDHSLIRVLPGSNATLSLSCDGRRMAVTCSPRGVSPFGTFVYDTTTWQPLSFIPDTGQAVGLSPDGSLLATGKGLRDALTGQVAHEWRTGGTGCFAFSPDGKYVATNDWAGDTVIYEIAPWRALRELPSAARCLAFSPDGSTLAVGGQDHAVRLWNWEQASNWRTWRGHDSVVTDIVWRQDGSHVYSGGMDGRINVWHVHASVPSKPEMRLDRVIGDLPGTGHLLCQNTAAELVIYDPGTEEILSTLPVPPGIAMLRLTEDRRAIHFVAGPETAAPRLVRMALPAGTVERETTLAGPLAPGHRRISADGTRIAVIGEKGIREAWDGLTGQRLHRSTTDRNIPEHASLAAGGSVIWEHGIESGFSAWSWPDWQLLWRKDQLHGKLFSNDATTFIACAQKDGVVTIHSLSDGAKLGTLTGHGTQVYEMDYSPDSTRLVTVCERETRLWALTTMSEVANLGTFRYARTIRFTADGSRLIIHLAGRRPHLLPAK